MGYLCALITLGIESEVLVMRTPTKTRREMLASMALGSGVATMGVAVSAMAQDDSAVSLPSAEEMRGIHRGQLDRAREELEELDGALALTEAGFGRARQSLVNEPLITEQESDALGSLISAILNSGSLDELLATVQSTYNETIEPLGSVASTIAAVLMDSVDYAAEQLTDIDYRIVSLVVAHDVRGAIDGALAGATVGRYFGGPVPSAVVGALAAGAAGSIIGHFDARERASRCG